MKIKLIKAAGVYADHSAIGKVHLSGPFDATACGLAEEEYHSKVSKQPITCTTCLEYFRWAKSVALKVNK